MKQRSDKEASMDNGLAALDEQESEQTLAAEDKPVKKPRARTTRKSKASEPELVVPDELERNPELQGASRSWLKLYSAIHKEVRR